MPQLKRVTSLPAFPENNVGLRRGTILKAKHEAVSQLGMKVGDKIPIGFDGEYIRCGPFTWDVGQLEDEITNNIWSIDGVVDLSDSERSLSFTRKIEQLEIVS